MAWSRTQDIHAMAKGLLFEEGLFVLLVPDVLLQDILFYTLLLLGVFPPASRTEYIFRRSQHTLRLPARCTRLFKLSQNLLVCRTVQNVVLRVVRRVVEVLVLGPVLVHVLGLDLKEKAVKCPCRGTGSFFRIAL